MERARERIDLGAGVVDVVFAGDIEAGLGKQCRQGVADDRAPSMTDMHRPGRIGRDVFDVDAAFRAHHRIAVSGSRAENRSELRAPEPVVEPQVDETGSGNLGGRDIRGTREPVGVMFGEVARFHAGRLGQHHRRVGRDVAVGRIARWLDREPGRVRAGPDHAFGLQPIQLTADQVAELVEYVHRVSS